MTDENDISKPDNKGIIRVKLDIWKCLSVSDVISWLPSRLTRLSVNTADRSWTEPHTVSSLHCFFCKLILFSVFCSLDTRCLRVPVSLIQLQADEDVDVMTRCKNNYSLLRDKENR